MTVFDQGIRQLITEAFAERASDVHIAPLEDGGRDIRIRVDGVLHAFRRIDGEWGEAFVRRLKRMSGCDVTKLGVPQSSSFRLDEPPITVRVGLMPTLRPTSLGARPGHGLDEYVTLRLLARGRPFELGGFGLPEAAEQDLREALDRTHGLLVFTGPTGAGKTTLLQHAVSALNGPHRSLFEVSDPIEYEVQGIAQTQVSAATPFSEVLRGLVRMDLDVAIVGEIRDAESARAAVSLAETAHTTLTTLHANDLSHVHLRLVDLGIRPVEIDELLTFVSAQRLVRTLCPVCRQPDARGLDRLRRHAPEVAQVFRATGCEHCTDGFRPGRRPLVGWAVEGEIRQSLWASVLTAASQGEIDAATALALRPGPRRA